jgi:hypothetical protein
VNTFQVVRESKLSDTIAINTGLSQGCILSPIIFLIVMDDVMNKMILGGGGGEEIDWGISQQQ